MSITWFRSSILSVTFDVGVNPSYATFPVKLPSAGVPRFIVLPSTLAMFAAVVQLSTPLPFVVKTCPVVPPVNVTALLAPKFTALPLRLSVLSAVIAFPDIARLAMFALPVTSNGCVGEPLFIPIRLLVTSTKNVLVSIARLVVLSRFAASALPVTRAMAIYFTILKLCSIYRIVIKVCYQDRV